MVTLLALLYNGFQKVKKIIKQKVYKMNITYFQTKTMNPKYCERGTIFEHDPEYIWYLDEPCKILISEVKIIDKENVTFNRKTGLCHVKNHSQNK